LVLEYTFPHQNNRAMMAKEKSVIAHAETLIFEQALIEFQGSYVGAVAALSQSGDAPGLNYGEVFIRDNVPVMLYLLLKGKTEIVRHFLNTCLQLQSNQFQTRGIFPTSFVEHEGKLIADYGQRAIGRVVSVDATLWWPILAWMYVQRTGDHDWTSLPTVQSGLQRFLELVLHPQFRDAPTLFVPDGAFMIDRPLDVWGAPLEIQVLLYGALLSSAGLMLHNQDCDQYLLARCLDRARKLRHYLLKHYWVNRQTIQVLRRRPTEEYGDTITNEYNIQTEMIPHWLQDWLGADGGFLLGNIRTGRPDFRFFTLGNCLGAIFGVISPRQQRSLFELVIHNQSSLVARMPMRICHPPLDDEEWRRKTGYDRKNLPWCYHNAGHWPSLSWYLVLAVQSYRKHYPDSSFDPQIPVLLEQVYQLLLKQLPRQRWAEYFDGPNGTWIGQQARLNQTWTIVGFLLVHHFLKVCPDDADILDLPVLKDLELKAGISISLE
jgi:hypothetical protein